MDILLDTADAALRETLRTALEGAGYKVRSWAAGHETADANALAIVDGPDRAAATTRLPCDVLALLDDPGLATPVATDFMLKPIHAEELLARVRLIEVRPRRDERTKEHLLSLAVQNASDIIEITNPHAVLEYVNPAYEATLGISPDEAIGKTPAQLVRSQEHPPEFFRELDATLQRGDTWKGVLISRSREDRLVHLETTITPVLDAKSEITHHLAVKRDITERLERQQALIEVNRALSQARDAAVEANRAKSEFLANMSHELRTPLNAIIGYSEMLAEDFEDNRQVSRDLGRIHTAGTHLLALINNVLDISRIEADRIELSPEWIAIPELMDLVTSTIDTLASKNNNKLTVKLDQGLVPIFIDRTRIRQVLLNLLGNACKFTKDGEVAVHASPIDRSGTPWVEFRVTDTGIGISEEHQAKLFQPFVQVDASTTREFGGTGLGLVICKRLAELMGGDISLSSRPGVGTTITVRVPVGSDAGEDVPESGDEATGGPMVLVIDDDPTVRDLVSRSLSKKGFRTRFVSGGAEGVEEAARLEPDAIVLDVKMPGMSGWEVLSALKLSEATAKIPVIMLTIVHQEEVGRALGAVDYLMKPISPKALVDTLRRHVRGSSARVLVVEDDAATRELIRRTLEGEGHSVVEAENGQVGLDFVTEDEPDIVVLDLMMPVMDGFEFLRQVRDELQLHSLPVIVATARILGDAERRDLETRVQRVIEKNAFSRNELLDAINTQIHEIVARAHD